MTHVKNPMFDLIDQGPNLEACKITGNTATGCTCTDPSYEYTRPCHIRNTSSNNNVYRNRCTYGNNKQTGIKPSTTSFSTTTNSTFTAKPNGESRQPFTNAGSSIPISSSGAATTYPSSLLLCLNPETGDASVTKSQPFFTYDSETQQFQNWTSKGDPNKTSNIGFS